MLTVFNGDRYIFFLRILSDSDNTSYFSVEAVERKSGLMSEISSINGTVDCCIDVLSPDLDEPFDTYEEYDLWQEDPTAYAMTHAQASSIQSELLESLKLDLADLETILDDDRACGEWDRKLSMSDASKCLEVSEDVLLTVFNGDRYAFLFRINGLPNGRATFETYAIGRKTELMAEVSSVNGFLDGCLDVLSPVPDTPFSAHGEEYERYTDCPSAYAMTVVQAQSIQSKLLEYLKLDLKYIECQMYADSVSGGEWVHAALSSSSIGEKLRCQLSPAFETTKLNGRSPLGLESINLPLNSSASASHNQPFSADGGLPDSSSRRSMPSR